MTPVPPLTPYLVVSDARAAVAFYLKAFGATQDGEIHVMPGTDKVMHARVIINGSMVMLADDFSEVMGGPCLTPPSLGGSPVTLALQVDDATAIFNNAIAAGATVKMPLADQFWGDRYGQFIDPFGHQWSVSQVIQVMTDEEMQQSAQKTMDEHGTLKATPIE